MRALLLVLYLTATASSEFYKPVLAPSNRVRHCGPIAVANQSESQLACDCARPGVCLKSFLDVPLSDCRAYAYRDQKCVILGDINPSSTCTANNTEYVLIDDPCIANKCGANGKCDVYDGWIAYCQCNEGFQGLECEEKIDSSQTGVSFENRTCYDYSQTDLGTSLKRAPNINTTNISYDACYGFMKSAGGNVFAVKNPACLSLIRDEVKIVPYEGDACTERCPSKTDQFCGGFRGGWLVDPKDNGSANPCDSSPCGGNGLCLRKKDGFSCLCKFGYGGDTCKPNP